MEEHIKLRLEYKKLIRDGKKEEAMKVLRKIQGKDFTPVTKKVTKKVDKKIIVETKETEVKTEVKIEVKKKVSKSSSLDSLTSINGLGKKSLEDLKKQFNTMEELKIALSEDKVALRDDVVEKLKEALKEESPQ